MGYQVLAGGLDQATPPVLKYDVNRRVIDHWTFKPREDEIIRAYEVVKNLDGCVAPFSHNSKHEWQLMVILRMYRNIQVAGQLLR
jgi:hypothetical protein